MAKLFFLLLVITMLYSHTAFSQSLNCSKFKDGKFKIVDAKAGDVTVIDRKGNYQVENNQTMKITLKFKVAWIDECTYALKLDSVLRNENNIPFPVDMILKVKITATTENSYTQESSSNTSSVFYKSEMIKIK